MNRSLVSPLTRKTLWQKHLRSQDNRKCLGLRKTENGNLPNFKESPHPSNTDLESLDDVNSPELVVPKALQTNQGPKKAVSFKPVVLCVLIPTAEEYRAYGLDRDIWWDAADYLEFKMSALGDLRELMRRFPELSEKQALRLYCKILNLQVLIPDYVLRVFDEDYALDSPVPEEMVGKEGGVTRSPQSVIDAIADQAKTAPSMETTSDIASAASVKTCSLDSANKLFSTVAPTTIARPSPVVIPSAFPRLEDLAADNTPAIDRDKLSPPAAIKRVDSVDVHKSHLSSMSMEDELLAQGAEEQEDKEVVIVDVAPSPSPSRTLSDDKDTTVSEERQSLTDSLLQFLYDDDTPNGLLPTMGQRLSTALVAFFRRLNTDT